MERGGRAVTRRWCGFWNNENTVDQDLSRVVPHALPTRCEGPGALPPRPQIELCCLTPGLEAPWPWPRAGGVREGGGRFSILQRPATNHPVLAVSMKALTIQQPMASAVVLGPKRVESRHFGPNLPPGGQWIAIHAGKSDRFLKDGPTMARLREMWPGECEAPTPDELAELPPSCPRPALPPSAY